MAPKNAKPAAAAPPPAAVENTPMGASPAALGKRNPSKKPHNNWCPQPEVEFDAMCDINNPKAIIYKDIVKAADRIKEDIPKTPLVRSQCCKQLEMELNYKIEIFHRTGSFNERGAVNALLMLTNEQKNNGIITASLGNWAMALAYHGHRYNVKVSVVLPENTLLTIVEKCKEVKATVVLHGSNFAEAKNKAFIIANEKGISYINGYDHPNVIAGSGTIGLEIMAQLPETDAILVPVGGGGLIAGICEAVKHIKPEVLVYVRHCRSKPKGIEPDKCCSFFKAMENNAPYTTASGKSVASMLGVSTAGFNAYYTARPYVDKMVLVDDDWIARSILQFVEAEKIIVEGAGATALGPLLTLPSVLPELKRKTVVCVITGGNLDNIILPKCMERAKAIEGRLIKLTAHLPADGAPKEELKMLSMIANIGCNVLQSYTESAWISENDLHTVYLNLICETRGLEHACCLKRVMEKLFPGVCEFLEEPFSPIPICTCFTKRRMPT